GDPRSPAWCCPLSAGARPRSDDEVRAHASRIDKKSVPCRGRGSLPPGGYLPRQKPRSTPLARERRAPGPAAVASARTNLARRRRVEPKESAAPRMASTRGDSPSGLHLASRQSSWPPAALPAPGGGARISRTISRTVSRLTPSRGAPAIGVSDCRVEEAAIVRRTARDSGLSRAGGKARAKNDTGWTSRTSRI